MVRKGENVAPVSRGVCGREEQDSRSLLKADAVNEEDSEEEVSPRAPTTPSTRKPHEAAWADALERDKEDLRRQLAEATQDRHSAKSVAAQANSRLPAAAGAVGAADAVDISQNDEQLQFLCSVY